MSVKNRNSIVTDGLVFYVDAGNEDSYAGSGGTWSDLVGSNDGSFNNMDDANNPSNNYDSGSGGSIVFDGVDDFIELSNDLFSGNNEGTLVAWFSPSTLNDSYRVFTQSSPSATLTQGAAFSFAPSAEGGIMYRHSGGNITYGSGIISAGSIHQMAAVIPSGATTTDNVLAYIDGINYSGTRTGGLNRTLNIGTGFVRIGLSPQSVGWFNGNIYSVMVYNKALSSTEILQNYNALKNRFI